MAKVMKNGGKAVTVEDLKKAGVPIVPVSDHGIKKYLNKKPKSIEDVRRALSKLKVPLSEEIIRMREEN